MRNLLYELHRTNKETHFFYYDLRLIPPFVQERERKRVKKTLGERLFYLTTYTMPIFNVLNHYDNCLLL